MDKLQKWLEEKMLPLANKVAKNKYLKAISTAFISAIPFMTIGSLALILIEPPMDYTTMDPGFLCSLMKGWSAMAATLRLPARAIYKIGLEYMGIYIAAGVAFFLSKAEKMKGFTPTVTGVASYMILAGLTNDSGLCGDFFGGTGLFSAIFASIISVEILKALVDKKVGKISLEGHGVPEALTESFAMLIPTAITLVVMALIHTAVVKITGDTFPSLMQTIMMPLLGASNSLIGGIFLVALVMTFWWGGIHDSAITGPMGVFWAAALAANVSAYAAGTPANQLPYIICEPFWWFFIMLGGSGATFALVFVLMFFCKSKQLKTVGKLGLVPAFFNINEPIIFGVPLMMNPVMFIPFVGVPVLNCVITYLAMAAKIVNAPVAYPGWNLFCPLAALISTVDIKAMILVLALIVIDGLVYLPFIKVLDKAKLAEEAK